MAGQQSKILRGNDLEKEAAKINKITKRLEIWFKQTLISSLL
ncbi:hypothetical protein SR187_5750 [Streptococcus ruminantium]|uniref:Uncharacterized protein n=1 Tax=Streptococcus ruminantium TaxID=1917441 RepID=A0A2Z5TQT3_9STRE|nr:hypothetical protein SR187_5750 [Streptococcus ruminantium]